MKQWKKYTMKRNRKNGRNILWKDIERIIFTMFFMVLILIRKEITYIKNNNIKKYFKKAEYWIHNCKLKNTQIWTFKKLIKGNIFLKNVYMSGYMSRYIKYFLRKKICLNMWFDVLQKIEYNKKYNNNIVQLYSII